MRCAWPPPDFSMKCLLPAFLLLSIAAPAQAPSQTATVMGKSESGNGFSIFIADGRSTSSMSRSGILTPGLRKAFRQLEVGRAYPFPDAFNLPADDSADFKQAPLLELEKRLPFRALVDHVQVMAQRVVLRLCCADGQKLEFEHVGAQDHAKAVALVSTLELEETYEFPAILKKEKPVLPADASSPLAQYVGEWRGTLDGDPGFYITMTCAWKADGQGLWREIMFDDSTDAPPVHDVAIVTSHGGGSALLARDPRQKDKPATQSSYDAASRTFTTPLPSPEPGVVRINTATFTTPDSITWKTVSQNADGTVLSTTSGTYQRLTRMNGTTRPSNITEELLRLPELPPFRATVIQRQISATDIKIDLKIRGSIPVTVGHSGQDGWDKALKMAKRLEVGRTYEFPDILADDYIVPPVGIMPQPASDAMRALQPFIGTWEETFEDGKKNIIRYFWKEDGTGLWREERREVEGEQNTASAAVLITYDAARQSYMQAPQLDFKPVDAVTADGVAASSELASSPVPRDEMARWDAATQTYIWQHVMDVPKTNTQYSGSRRFVSPDRMESQAKAMAEDGTVLQEVLGHYDRVKP